MKLIMYIMAISNERQMFLSTSCGSRLQGFYDEDWQRLVYFKTFIIRSVM